MPFMQVSVPRRIPGVGPSNAKVAIVGEAGGAYEDRLLKPFVGPAGTVLEKCLHAAGLIRSEVYLTNVVKLHPRGNDITPYYNPTKGTFTDAGREFVRELQEELNELNPNIIVACGATAMSALTGHSKITKLRGYIFESIGLQRAFKVLPTIHPAASLRGQYIYQHIIAADLKKAKEFSDTPELIRPDRQLVYNFTTTGEILEWLEYYEQQPMVGLDIEVLNYEVSCIALSSDPMIAISIPLDTRWSESDECLIWRGLQRVLGNTRSIKVIQNSIFDVHFLLTRCGIEIRGPIHDTMCGHSVMYPELLKSLNFLGSIYCGSTAYWKGMVKFTNIKEES